jgi:RNA polymerase sigma factor (sigma-70 family)
MKYIDPQKQFRRFSKGDRKAMNYFHNRYCSMLVSFLRKFAQDDNLAKELLPQVFLVLDTNHKNIRDEEHLLTFLYQTGCKLLKERGKIGNDKACLEARDAEVARQTGVVPNGDGGLIRTMLDVLTPRRRQIVVMRYIQGLEVKEIARELLIKPQTVRNHLSKSLKILRKLMGDGNDLSSLFHS